MKKFLFCILLILCFPFVSFALNEYGQFYKGDPNFPIIYGHMGQGYYIDKSSAVILKNDAQGLVFAINILSVNIDKNLDNFKVTTCKFYKPSSTDIYTVYEKIGSAQTWTPLDLADTHGSNLYNREAFLKGWEAATGFSYGLQ